MEARRATSKFMYDFSLWYSETDEDIASDIAETLRRAGHQGYLEHHDGIGGTLAISSVTEVIQSSRITIVILSTDSLGSRWCQQILEWNMSHSIEKDGAKFIPVYVRMQEEQAPTVLRHINGLDYSSKYFKTRLLTCMKIKKTRCTRVTS